MVSQGFQHYVYADTEPYLTPAHFQLFMNYYFFSHWLMCNLCNQCRVIKCTKKWLQFHTPWVIHI